ncbi:acetyl-CoA carboxylase biotin carboxylase subunit [Streptomyces pseudovenezuelae]|uniref:Biotin carboxylase n=1 Tax=Streptomyces pseudovenezuelae TaxID=67350 RepID=A0ABT6LKP7_9ACTN|nr:acetyl-CoA carboxylase biotin carboxylase subunit [Streptomyces pseudovenezuelae]MDH6216873.1 acetyl-CoA carboxylase biotin carboxylase subunit [Streptomyces pseudovenezuelae]
MFEKVLIANRGEIALRIIRTCRDLGVPTVAVYSTPDAEARFVRAADESVHIGPGAPSRSYLNIPNIIGAALRTGADAVHPGYGFLSEDPYFAEICADAGVTFIGPPPDVMENVGDKATARRLMTEAGLPLLPGTTEPVDSADSAEQIAREIGYPVIIKAAAGGGGRGITVVHRAEDLRDAYARTRAGAQAVFKNSAVYIERYLTRTRHIEIQVLCDDFGGAIHLGERDCSVQRRHQKLVEESPGPNISPELRERLGAAAVAGARAVGYRGAGTVEFLLETDPAAADTFWFMEMNARIQVEHPVTELVTGVDIVSEQLRVASGAPLSVKQEDVVVRGHAIECRINAEDPDRDFAPTPGLLENYRVPGGPWVRVDTDYVPGSRVSPYYDSMIGKLIVWGPDRATALDRARRALAEFDVSGPGVHTTIPLHQEILSHPEFTRTGVTTDFLERNFAL